MSKSIGMARYARRAYMDWRSRWACEGAAYAAFRHAGRYLRRYGQRREGGR